MAPVGSIKEAIMSGLVKNRAVLGLEIGKNYTRLAILKKTKHDKEAVFLENIYTKEMSDTEKISAISGSLKKSNYKAEEVILIIPSNLVMTKTLQIPSVKENEIRDILNLQAGRHTPYSREELVLDYVVLGRVQDIYTKILVVMAARDIINSRIAMLESSGLKVSKVLFLPEGISRMASELFKPDAGKAPKILLNVGTESSDFNIFSATGLMFTRNIPVDQNQFLDNKDKALEKLAEELKRSMELYNTEEIAERPDEIYISCNANVWLEIENPIREAFTLEVKRFFINDYISVPDTEKEIFRDKNEQFTALLSSLAVYDKFLMDLMPEDTKEHRRFEAKAKKFIVIGILAMVIFLQICLALLFKIYYTQKYLDMIDAKFKEEIKKAEHLQLISDRTRVVNDFLSGKNTPLQVIVSLYDILPDDIYLQSIAIDKDKSVFVKGTSESVSRIFEIVTSLEENPLYKGVKTEFTESRKKEGKNIADFGITMVIEEDGK
ncbi:MAG: pilus assembly protein PilM [Candidatus Omnitrophica bacterium]|nr:pilus assembly protein PilM [Candidatus Omnitrophota bacterium]